MEKQSNQYDDPFLTGNDQIELAIHAFYEQPSQAALMEILTAIHLRALENGHLIVPVDTFLDDHENECFNFKTLQLDEQKIAAVAFTAQTEFEKAPPSGALSHFIDSVLTAVCENEYFSGLLLNPWGESFLLTRDLILAILEQSHVCNKPDIPQRNPYIDELDAMEQPYVNAYINNISFPTDIEGLEYFVYKHGCFNVENVLTEPNTNWTMPRSAKVGDIVLFFHAKTAVSRITALITQVNSLADNSGHNKPLLLEWLERARSLFKVYGGKVFAVGRVTGSPEYWPSDGTDNPYHWKGRVYADIGDIVVLNNPIDISEFNSFIKVSRQSAITPLPSREFNGLRQIVCEKNEFLPEYFTKCEIGNFDLSHINAENFLTVTQAYRRRFLLEIDFRSYYVDYLLKGIARRKHWQECRCHTEGKPHYYVDNVFFYEGRYYLLEVKLNVQLEKDLYGQLQQYICADYLYLDKDATKRVDSFERKFMYVIDTEALYRYDADSNALVELVRLDDVHDIKDITQYLIIY